MDEILSLAHVCQHRAGIDYLSGSQGSADVAAKSLNDP